MKFVRHLFAVSVMALTLGHAATTDATEVAGPRREGIYGVAQVGLARSSWDLKNGPYVPSGHQRLEHQSKAAWQFGLGWRLSDHWGLEVSHGRLRGPVQRTGVGSLDLKASTAVVKAYLPLTDDLELFAGYGVGRSTTRFKAVQGITPYSNQSRSGIFYTGTLGAHYFLTRHVAVRAEVSGFGAESAKMRHRTDAGRVSVMQLGVGLEAHF